MVHLGRGQVNISLDCGRRLQEGSQVRLVLRLDATPGARLRTSQRVLASQGLPVAELRDCMQCRGLGGGHYLGTAPHASDVDEMALIDPS